jgi:hypothetical protein
VLGALLFALALECALAKKEVRLAKRAAETRALNCEGYKRVQASVFQRSCKWKHTLFFLAGIALYCTVGLIMSQAFIYGKTEVFHTGDDDVVSTVEIDIIIGTELIKEAQLLFMMMQFVMEVNKEADTIISTLLVATWGESSSSARDHRSHANRRRWKLAGALGYPLIPETVSGPNLLRVAWGADHAKDHLRAFDFCTYWHLE